MIMKQVEQILQTLPAIIKIQNVSPDKTEETIRKRFEKGER